MAVVAPLRPGAEPGVYRGDVLFTMGGTWDLLLRTQRASQRIEVPFPEEALWVGRCFWSRPMSPGCRPRTFSQREATRLF